jgi:hypothetical protein
VVSKSNIQTKPRLYSHPYTWQDYPPTYVFVVQVVSGFPTNILYAFLFSPFVLHALPISDLIILIILGEEYKLWSSSLCSFLQPPVTFSLSLSLSLWSTYSPQRLVLRHPQFVSHPYKTTGRIIVLCILIFMFLDSRREDKSFWSERHQALPEFSLLLIYSWIKLWFIIKTAWWWSSWIETCSKYRIINKC